MTYILDWSNPSKGAITLPDTTVDTTSTSLTLFGLDAPNYGEGQQENFIRMLENFASDTAPPNPTSGQTWWDTTMNKLKAYDGAKWELASGGVTNSTTAPTTPLEGTLWYDLANHKLMLWNGFQWMQVYPSLAAGNVVKVANVDEYNATATKINQIIGAPTGTTYASAYGYGQYLVSTESISSLTNQKCIDLETLVGRLSTHLGMSITSLGNSGYIYENGNVISKGIVSLVSEYNAMQSNVDNMLVGTNRFNATGLQSLTPTAGSTTRSVAWTGTLTQEILVSFDSANLLLGYFNAGGKVDFSASMAGGSTSRDTVVQTFLSGLGTISFNAGATTNGTISGIMGLYGVSTTYANIFTTTSGASSYTIAARFENSNRALRFRVSIANTTSSSPTVGGTLTSGVVLKKAADANLVAPTIKYPMVSSTVLSTTSNPVSLAITPQPAISYRNGAGVTTVSLTATASSGQTPYNYVWSNIPVGMTITGGIPPVNQPSILWGWGYNLYGQVGDLTIVDKSSPTQVISATWLKLSDGRAHAHAIKTDGTLWAWGMNASNGELGIGSLQPKSSPVQVGALSIWNNIDCGGAHNIATQTDGTVWLWGNNDYGQLGDLTRTSKSSPIQLTSLSNLKSVSAGIWHTAAIKTDGTLWTWGNNPNGELGDNTIVQKSSPIQIGNLTTWSIVSCGDIHTAAIKTDGTLWAWGNNTYGQLGDGTSNRKSSPIQIGIAGQWKDVCCGYNHTVAIKTDGTLWAWGSNAMGELGDNSQTARSTPVQISAPSTWTKVGAGINYSAGIKTDGTLWTWGTNAQGRLGIIGSGPTSTPTQVGSSTNWIDLSVGSDTVHATSASSSTLNSYPTIELTGILSAAQTLAGEIKCSVTDGTGNVANAATTVTMSNQPVQPNVVTSLLPGTPLSCALSGANCAVTTRNIITVYYDKPYTSMDVSSVFLSPTLMPAGVTGAAFALTQGWIDTTNGHQYYVDVTTNGPAGIYEATVIFTVTVQNSAGDNYTLTRNLVCRQTHA